jgi:hypothetical protein
MRSERRVGPALYAGGGGAIKPVTDHAREVANGRVAEAFSEAICEPVPPMEADSDLVYMSHPGMEAFRGPQRVDEVLYCLQQIAGLQPRLPDCHYGEINCLDDGRHGARPTPEMD